MAGDSAQHEAGRAGTRTQAPFIVLVSGWRISGRNLWKKKKKELAWLNIFCLFMKSAFFWN